MNGRRGFIKGFGLFGAMVAGASVGAAKANNAINSARDISNGDGNNVLAAPAQRAEDISEFAPPDNAHTLQITGCYGPPIVPDCKEEPEAGVYCISSWGRSNVTNSVNMTVGKDNRLWMKVGDEWRRVALEG